MIHCRLCQITGDHIIKICFLLRMCCGFYIENVTYTCEISNSVGEVSHNITARASGNMDNVEFSCTAHVVSLIFMQSNPKQL